MNYVPNYQHDLFVSYARVDNLPVPGAERGWVSNLVSHIETKLAQKLGRSDAFDLWMDYEISGHEPLTPQILDAARQSALLLVVLSPGYVASPWCRRERQTFLDLVRERGNASVFVVEREAPLETERLKEFDDLRGFTFWVQERERRAPRILGDPAPSPSDREYYSRVDDLCEEIAQELRRLRAGAGAAPLRPGLSDAAAIRAGPTVFLADVTDDLETERNQVKRYLHQLGVQVLPETWYSLEPKAFQEEVIRDLGGCALFVQLLSAAPGKRPADLPQGYVRLQYALALDAGKPMMLWRSPGLNLDQIEDRGHRALVDAPTVFAEGFEEFKQAIRDRLFAPPAPPAPSHPNAFVFVDMDSADRPLAAELCQALYRFGVDFALPIQSDNPRENRRDLEENLSACDAVIIIYGVTTVDWVREQLRHCRKAIARRERPLQALALFEGPPEDKRALDMHLHNLRILNCRRGISEAELKRFLDIVQAESAV